MRAYYLFSRWAILVASLVAVVPGQAQNLLTIPRQAFDYMQLTVMESADQNYAKLLFSPSFQAYGEVSLDALNSNSSFINEFRFRNNAEKVTKYLGEVSAGGWDLLEVHPAPYIPSSNVYTTRYLFRKPKP